MKTLNEHLKTKTFKNVYLLYGDEAYLRNQYRDKLKKAMINEGDTMNFSCFEGKGIDEKELTAMADTVPFFSDYRLIIFLRRHVLFLWNLRWTSEVSFLRLFHRRDMRRT